MFRLLLRQSLWQQVDRIGRFPSFEIRLPQFPPFLFALIYISVGRYNALGGRPSLCRIVVGKQLYRATVATHTKTWVSGIIVRSIARSCSSLAGTVYCFLVHFRLLQLSWTGCTAEIPVTSLASRLRPHIFLNQGFAGVARN